MIDLRSDTATKPTEQMLAAMAAAEVGDEQLREDPTTTRLEERVAELFGKPAAVFLPTGTMCNVIGIAAQARPGSLVVAESNAHVMRAEGGSAAVVASVLIDPIESDTGWFDLAALEAKLVPGDRHRPPIDVVSLEQTHNLAGGKVWPLDVFDAVVDAARTFGARVHVDGARILNAVAASGTAAARWAAEADTIWLDLSKGLGGPVGAVLAGDEDVIDESWSWKHRLGGALRQSGVIAAAGLYALDHHVARLVDDHHRATRLAEALAELGCIVTPPETNIVFFDPAPCGLSASAFAARAGDAGAPVSTIAGRARAVTHLGVSDDDLDAAVQVFTNVVSGR